ncbi:hypothetical protein LX36DRAFT_700278 [Colletotrichum falcatum]|nr:hypothetical protein LX36DRAFT_700278 [Colletotrichum falcatum]
MKATAAEKASNKAIRPSVHLSVHSSVLVFLGRQLARLGGWREALRPSMGKRLVGPTVKERKLCLAVDSCLCMASAASKVWPHQKDDPASNWYCHSTVKIASLAGDSMSVCLGRKKHAHLDMCAEAAQPMPRYLGTGRFLVRPVTSQNHTPSRVSPIVDFLALHTGKSHAWLRSTAAATRHKATSMMQVASRATRPCLKTPGQIPAMR